MVTSAERTTEPWVESPWLEAGIAARGLAPDLAELARQYHRDGFALVPHVLGNDQIVRILDEVIGSLEGKGRVQDAWKFSPAVRDLALDSRVLDLLRMLYGREPVPFQTLNFEFGTQQDAHSDTVHFSSLPPRYMCGVWVALEDVDADNGPLFYYPGSHRLPDPYFQRFGLPLGLDHYDKYAVAQQELVVAHGLERVEFHATAGDALIWSANLVHGGMPILEAGRTRWSQVTHYFFDGCVYVTPLLSDPELGEWYVRTELENIGTGEVAVHSYNHEPVHFESLGNGRHRIHRGPPASTNPLQAEVDELRRQLRVARLEADDRAAQLEAMRRSRAYRAGSAVVAPARWLRKVLHRTSGSDARRRL